MSFRKKIDMILEAKKLQRLSKNKIEQMIGVDGTIYKAYNDDREPADSEIVRNLIGTLGIRQQWWDKEWESGSKDIFNTSVQGEAAVAEKPLGEQKDIYKELYNKFIGEGSEYLLIHRDVLKEHRLVAVEQFEKDQRQMEQNAKELDRRAEQLEGLRELVKELSARPINIHLPKVQKA